MGGGHESSQGRSLKSSSATSSQSATSQPQSTEPVLMCYCGRRAKKLTSRTIKNPQRDFYTCDLSQVMAKRNLGFRGSGFLAFDLQGPF